MSDPKCVTHFDGCACVTAHRIELGHEVQRLKAECERLKKDAEYYKLALDTSYEVSDNFRKERDALAARCARLERVLDAAKSYALLRCLRRVKDPIEMSSKTTNWLLDAIDAALQSPSPPASEELREACLCCRENGCSNGCKCGLREGRDGKDG